MTITTFQVMEIVGENCITLEDGETIYELIHPILANGEAVALDFTGVRIFASPFMNAAIGQLLLDLKPDDLNRLLIIDREKITPVGLSILRRVIQNAKAYYADPLTKQAVDEVLQAHPEA